MCCQKGRERGKYLLFPYRSLCLQQDSSQYHVQGCQVSNSRISKISDLVDLLMIIINSALSCLYNMYIKAGRQTELPVKIKQDNGLINDESDQ